MLNRYHITLFALLLCFVQAANAQIDLSDTKPFAINYQTPIDYRIANVSIEGTEFLDRDVLLTLSGLRVGETIAIPSDKTAKAVQNLWKQGLFSDIQLYVDKIEDKNIFLIIYLKERPRLTKYAYSRNLTQAKTDDLNDKLKGFKGKIVTEDLKTTVASKIREYYVDKGFWDASTIVSEVADTAIQNGMILKLNVQPGKRMKIQDITFEGNSKITSKVLKRQMKDTKEARVYNVFKSSKLLDKKYDDDKQKIIAKYQDLGYRDAQITFDTIYKVPNRVYNDWKDEFPNAIPKERFQMTIKISEGNQYYFRNITFKGNTIYPDSILTKVVGIKPGETYNQSLLQLRLNGDQSGRDITSLYMDDGYLFFQLNPVELHIDNDSIDIEVRIREGAQATVNKITIVGNDKTNDHVVLRELRTRPGQKFNRSDIIRTTRELAQFGFFDPEQIGVNPVPNPNDGTVDIEYKVAERSSDQIELSGGWGGFSGIVGSLGLNLNNFSSRKILDKSAWRPLPSGDGQRLSFRAQTNGPSFRSFNASFTEPWLGGKKPNSLSTSIFTSYKAPGLIGQGVKRSWFKKDTSIQSISITGGSIILAQRLKIPDDYFFLSSSINYQRYSANNYQFSPIFRAGTANNFFIKEALSRNSVDNPIYPRSGAQFNLSVEATLPYSLINKKDYNEISLKEKYKFVEYHKWRFDASWFTKLAGNLVLNTKVQYGIIGGYNRKYNLEMPFRRFFMGGSGITGFNLDDRELIALRGYEDNTLASYYDPTTGAVSQLGGVAFQKYVTELRYPISLNPQATIYMLAFLEAGNSFFKLKDFDPFNNYRSAGAGVRVFLPMFGLLGVDWGYGFDNAVNRNTRSKGHIHVSIGQQF